MTFDDTDSFGKAQPAESVNYTAYYSNGDAPDNTHDKMGRMLTRQHQATNRRRDPANLGSKGRAKEPSTGREDEKNPSTGREDEEEQNGGEEKGKDVNTSISERTMSGAPISTDAEIEADVDARFGKERENYAKKLTAAGIIDSNLINERVKALEDAKGIQAGVDADFKPKFEQLDRKAQDLSQVEGDLHAKETYLGDKGAMLDDEIVAHNTEVGDWNSEVEGKKADWEQANAAIEAQQGTVPNYRQHVSDDQMQGWGRALASFGSVGLKEGANAIDAATKALGEFRKLTRAFLSANPMSVPGQMLASTMVGFNTMYDTIDKAGELAGIKQGADKSIVMETQKGAQYYKDKDRAEKAAHYIMQMYNDAISDVVGPDGDPAQITVPQRAVVMDRMKQFLGDEMDRIRQEHAAGRPQNLEDRAIMSAYNNITKETLSEAKREQKEMKALDRKGRGLDRRTRGLREREFNHGHSLDVLDRDFARNRSAQEDVRRKNDELMDRKEREYEKRVGANAKTISDLDKRIEGNRTYMDDIRAKQADLEARRNKAYDDAISENDRRKRLIQRYRDIVNNPKGWVMQYLMDLNGLDVSKWNSGGSISAETLRTAAKNYRANALDEINKDLSPEEREEYMRRSERLYGLIKELKEEAEAILNGGKGRGRIREGQGSEEPLNVNVRFDPQTEELIRNLPKEISNILRSNVNDTQEGQNVLSLSPEDIRDIVTSIDRSYNSTQDIVAAVDSIKTLIEERGDYNTQMMSGFLDYVAEGFESGRFIPGVPVSGEANVAPTGTGAGTGAGFEEQEISGDEEESKPKPVWPITTYNEKEIGFTFTTDEARDKFRDKFKSIIDWSRDGVGESGGSFDPLKLNRSGTDKNKFLWGGPGRWLKDKLNTELIGATNELAENVGKEKPTDKEMKVAQELYAKFKPIVKEVKDNFAETKGNIFEELNGSMRILEKISQGRPGGKHKEETISEGPTAEEKSNMMQDAMRGYYTYVNSDGKRVNVPKGMTLEQYEESLKKESKTPSAENSKTTQNKTQNIKTGKTPRKRDNAKSKGNTSTSGTGEESQIPVEPGGEGPGGDGTKGTDGAEAGSNATPSDTLKDAKWKSQTDGDLSDKASLDYRMKNKKSFKPITDKDRITRYDEEVLEFLKNHREDETVGSLISREVWEHINSYLDYYANKSGINKDDLKKLIGKKENVGRRMGVGKGNASVVSPAKKSSSLDCSFRDLLSRKLGERFYKAL